MNTANKAYRRLLAMPQDVKLFLCDNFEGIQLLDYALNVEILSFSEAIVRAIGQSGLDDCKAGHLSPTEVIQRAERQGWLINTGDHCILTREF